MSDAGEYECQVSSNEPKISRIIRLNPVGMSRFYCIRAITVQLKTFVPLHRLTFFLLFFSYRTVGID